MNHFRPRMVAGAGQTPVADIRKTPKLATRFSTGPRGTPATLSTSDSARASRHQFPDKVSAESRQRRRRVTDRNPERPQRQKRQLQVVQTSLREHSSRSRRDSALTTETPGRRGLGRRARRYPPNVVGFRRNDSCSRFHVSSSHSVSLSDCSLQGSLFECAL
jgi:hypothetical protein